MLLGMHKSSDIILMGCMILGMHKPSDVMIRLHVVLKTHQSSGIMWMECMFLGKHNAVGDSQQQKLLGNLKQFSLWYTSSA